MTGPYTTIKVEEYNKLTRVIKLLRANIQKAREYLEKDQVQDALYLLRVDVDLTDDPLVKE